MKQQTQTKQLPNGWKEVKLSEVLDYEQPTEYIIHSEILEEETSVPVLTANKGFVRGYTKETKGIFNDIPVIIFDDFTTDTKFVNFPFKVKSSAMKILKLKDKDALLKYIFYQMQTFNVRATTHKRYYLSEYQNLDFLFPVDKNQKISLEEQQAIVSAIETQFTRLDESVKSLQAVKQKLEVYRKAVLKKAFEKKEGWISSNIGNEVKVRYGKGLPDRVRNNEGSIPVYASAGRVGTHNVGLIDFPTIVVARKGSIGNNFIVKEPCWPIDTVYYLENIKLDINYLFHFLNFSVFKDTSTAVPSLRRGDLEAIKISYPPSLSEQSQIVQSIEDKFSVIDKLEQVVEASLSKADKLRKSILKAAFEGKLVKNG